MALTIVIIIIILYDIDISLLERCPYDLDTQLRIIKHCFSSMGMIVNSDKTKVIIIKSEKIIISCMKTISRGSDFI